MKRLCLVLAIGVALFVWAAVSQQAQTTGPYKVLKMEQTGGAGGFDYIYADSDGRRLYIPRRGNPTRPSRGIIAWRWF